MKKKQEKIKSEGTKKDKEITIENKEEKIEKNKETKESKFLTSLNNVFLFIILFPFHMFRYFNIALIYILKLMLRETPEKRQQRLQKEEEKRKEIQKEQERAEEYIREKSLEKKNELKFSNDTIKDNNPENEKRRNKEERREEHRIAKEKINREKLRQREAAKKERKSLLEELKKRNFFSKKRQQKLDKKRQILALDVNAADANRSTEKLIFKYVGKNPNGKIEKGTFMGYSKLDVHSYLLSEGYEVYEINAIAKANMFNIDLALRKPMKKDTLVFYLTQLSTYLKAGIPIVDSIKILESQAKKSSDKTIWKSIVYELSMGATLSEAMIKSGPIFPKLLINMIKTAEMTGNLPEVLDEQAEYYKSVAKSRKEMINALIYPAFVFVFAIAVVIYIIVYVVPQFESIYKSLGSELPAITKFIINVSSFFRTNYITIIFAVTAIIVSFIVLFKKSVSFKSSIQYLLMHVPAIDKIIIYNEMTMFSKTFASLINNNIFITDSMDILSRITENEIYKSIIYDAVIVLSKGENISTAFENQWAFPNIAYQMIVTGEKTGQLGLMMEKVADYYQEEQTNSVARIKALVEPLMIIILAVVVGGILLAVIIPMFSMYENII